MLQHIAVHHDIETPLAERPSKAQLLDVSDDHPFAEWFRELSSGWIDLDARDQTIPLHQYPRHVSGGGANLEDVLALAGHEGQQRVRVVAIAEIDRGLVSEGFAFRDRSSGASIGHRDVKPPTSVRRGYPDRGSGCSKGRGIPPIAA